MSQIHIQEISSAELNTLESLMVVSPQKPYRFISKGAERKIAAFWLKRINENLKENQNRAFVCMIHGEMAGFMVLSALLWDSNIFGIPMASISEYGINPTFIDQINVYEELSNHVVEYAKRDGFRYILSKTYTDDMPMIHALERCGFQLVDTLLDYWIDFRKNPFSMIPEQKTSTDTIIRFANPADEKELTDLARISFKNHFGRYHSDPHFTNKQATEVYVEWMRSSLKGYADYFVLAEIEGRIAGLSIWKKTSEDEERLPAKISHYSIGAIHPDFFGKGLFTKLTYEGMKLFDGETDVIEGPTHINNYAVQRGYARLNWQICDARHSFHKWLD